MGTPYQENLSLYPILYKRVTCYALLRSLGEGDEVLGVGLDVIKYGEHSGFCSVISYAVIQVGGVGVILGWRDNYVWSSLTEDAGEDPGQVHVFVAAGLVRYGVLVI